MSDEIDIEAGEPLGVVSPEDEDQPDVSGDALLNLLIHMAEKGAASPITVFSQGQTFSGTIVSRQRYYATVTEQMAMVGETPLRIIFEEVSKWIEENVAEAGDPAPDYDYLHLLGGQVVAPAAASLPEGGMPIRLARSAIIGWSPGTLSFESR